MRASHLRRPRPVLSAAVAGLVGLGAIVGATLVAGSSAYAAPAAVNLGSAADFGVLGSTAVSNTGPTLITGQLGLSPNTSSSITGFPPGVASGATHAADGVAAQARSDARAAYIDLQNRGSQPGATVVTADLGGQTLVAGVYAGPLSLTGTLTLDGQNNADSVFIFTTDSTLITSTSSQVALINGADACRVFWRIGSSATLQTSTVFVGSILAEASITAVTGASVNGRLVALDGAVTLDSNVITRSVCDTAPPVTDTTTTDTSTTDTTTTDTTTAGTTADTTTAGTTAGTTTAGTTTPGSPVTETSTVSAPAPRTPVTDAATPGASTAPTSRAGGLVFTGPGLGGTGTGGTSSGSGLVFTGAGLATTGTPDGALVVIGLVVLMSGLALVAVTRRRALPR
ncbi:MAG: hypothetical protein JWN61_888 [Pseudonocardiales bacterium]|nr:hypothetical protein [Pseudonocardiales bacterium]